MSITRRTFMQSAAAAFAACSLGKLPSLTAAEPMPIDYSLFMTKDHWCRRYDIDKPFSHSATTYATDSRILIAHAGEFDGNAEARIPRVSDLMWDEFERGGWKPWPKESLLITDESGHPGECPKCLGNGRVGEIVECEKCGGDYEEYFGDDAVSNRPPTTYPDIHGRIREAKDTCPACTLGWTGGKLCSNCKGKGESTRYMTAIGDRRINGYYDSAIRTLGDVEYRTIGGAEDAIAFRFEAAGGGKGFVMPIVEWMH